MRKSIRVAPGVRLNVSKGGIGTSAGAGGVRYSVHSSGRRTVSARTGVPGVYYQKSVSGRSGGRPAAAPVPPRTKTMPALFYVRTAALPTASRVPRRRARSLQARSPFAFTRRSDPSSGAVRACSELRRPRQEWDGPQRPGENPCGGLHLRGSPRAARRPRRVRRRVHSSHFRPGYTFSQAIPSLSRSRPRLYDIARR
jgi:hypothetical protein